MDLKWESSTLLHFWRLKNRQRPYEIRIIERFCFYCIRDWWFWCKKTSHQRCFCIRNQVCCLWLGWRRRKSDAAVAANMFVVHLIVTRLSKFFFLQFLPRSIAAHQGQVESLKSCSHPRVYGNHMYKLIASPSARLSLSSNSNALYCIFISSKYLRVGHIETENRESNNVDVVLYNQTFFLIFLFRWVGRVKLT